MEFEQEPTITDEQRTLAATKNVTIEPLNPTVAREELEVPTIIERHANVESDSEDTAHPQELLQPSKGALVDQPQAHNHSFTIFLILAGLVAGIVGGAALFIAVG